MKIAVYCQHVLGIGHLHRCLTICHELKHAHAVTLILGGPEVAIDTAGLSVIQLPGLQMNTEFKELRPCTPDADLDTVKEQRAAMLFALVERLRPDIFLVELYPFGRKAFRFELDPVLAAIAEGRFGRCSSYVSLRDILVERPADQERFEKRCLSTLNAFFHGLLIHADDSVVRLEETFARFDEIRVPVAYTGFIAPAAAHAKRVEIRREMRLAPDAPLVVVSAGGGSVGGELPKAALAAFPLLRRELPAATMQVFTGPYCPDALYSALRQHAPEGTTVSRFSDTFPTLLEAADLSISLAGYNTCMAVLQAGVPALFYPFRQNQEQALRCRKLSRHAPLRLLEEDDFHPTTLARIMLDTLASGRHATAIRLDGARQTVRQLEQWQQAQGTKP